MNTYCNVLRVLEYALPITAMHICIPGTTSACAESRLDVADLMRSRNDQRRVRGEIITCIIAHNSVEAFQRINKEYSSLNLCTAAAIQIAESWERRLLFLKSKKKESRSDTCD